MTLKEFLPNGELQKATLCKTFPVTKSYRRNVEAREILKGLLCIDGEFRFILLQKNIVSLRVPECNTKSLEITCNDKNIYLLIKK
jgi:hypothetical protein